MVAGRALQKPCIFMSTELAPEEQKHKSDKSASWRSQYPAGCILMTVVTWSEQLPVIYGLPRD
jgi:hypothetical protein